MDDRAREGKSLKDWMPTWLFKTVETEQVIAKMSSPVRHVGQIMYADREKTSASISGLPP